ncbi:MAG: hypothetical protein R3266_11155 [Gemmatimonadota bacterium]|nr:hypothetical protein [Gemmatimonadota bacterium]
MDMDLVVILSFVTGIVLIITVGIVFFPIARKLGHFLEEAAKERAERVARGAGRPAPLRPGAQEDIVQALTNLERRIGEVAERQAFTERLLEERHDAQVTRPAETHD